MLGVAEVRARTADSIALRREPTSWSPSLARAQSFTSCEAQAQVTALACPGDSREANGIQGRVHPRPLPVPRRCRLTAKGRVVVDPSQAAKVLANPHNVD